MANVKNITELPMAESAEGLNLIVNDGGAAKQIAASEVICSSNSSSGSASYDIVLDGYYGNISGQTSYGITWNSVDMDYDAVKNKLNNFEKVSGIAKIMHSPLNLNVVSECMFACYHNDNFGGVLSFCFAAPTDFYGHSGFLTCFVSKSGDDFFLTSEFE